MLLGSVFHLAMEDCFNNDCSKQWSNDTLTNTFWEDMFRDVMMLHPNDTYEATPADISSWCVEFTRRDAFCGKTLGEIAQDTFQFIKVVAGFEIVRSELKLRYEDLYGPHVGTLDLLMKTRDGNLAIADYKTSGMWGRLLAGKGITKQSMTSDQVKFHPQMSHYHWLAVRSKHVAKIEDITQYSIIYPANLIPYLSGAKAGRARGIPIVTSACSHKAVRRYEEDLHMWLQMIMAKINLRAYPNVFGKISCPKCPFSNECLGDQDSTYVPDYLK